MPAHGEVEAAKSITRQGISTALQDDCSWSVIFHHAADYWLKDTLVALVVDPVTQRDINSVVFSTADANVMKVAGARKEIAIFVERHCHDTIGAVEGFFDTIAVMHINVDIDNARMEAQELNNA